MRIIKKKCEPISLSLKEALNEFLKRDSRKDSGLPKDVDKKTAHTLYVYMVEYIRKDRTPNLFLRLLKLSRFL